MILKTTRVEDWDRFMAVFSTESADRRRALGCRGVSVYRDPDEGDRVWAVFDWDEEGWAAFVGDPAVPPMMQRAGHKGRPQSPLLVADLDA